MSAEKANILSEKERALSNLRSSQGKSRSQFLRGRLSGSGDHSATAAAAMGPSPTAAAAAGDSIAHASRQLGSFSGNTKRKGGSFFLKRDFNANGGTDDNGTTPPGGTVPIAASVEAPSPLATAPPPNSVNDVEPTPLLNNSTPRATKLWGVDSDSDRERELSPAAAPIRNPLSPKDSIQEENKNNSDRKSDTNDSAADEKTAPEDGAKPDKRITKKIRRDSFGLVVKNPKAGMKRLSMTTQAGQAAFAAAATAAFQEATARKPSQKPEDDLDVEPDEVDEIYEKTIMKAIESVKKEGPGDADLEI